jgi:hypothetical protein
MKHHYTGKKPTAAHVLSINATEVAPFVRKCVEERSLSVIVKDLNHDMIFGTSEQREAAREALRHIGFIE